MDRKTLRNILMNRGKNYAMKFDIKARYVKNNKNYVRYNNGPTLYFDGHKNTTIFELYSKLNVTELTTEALVAHLIYIGQPNQAGIYLLDNGGKRIVVQTKNIVKSMAKVIIDASHVKNITDEDMVDHINPKKKDVFALRLATAPVMKFEILSLSSDPSRAAIFAGINDTMNPSVTLGSFISYQNYPEYRKGLELGGHYTSLLIERMLDNKTYPEFIKPSELYQWRPAIKDFSDFHKISADMYNQERNNIMNNK